MQKKEKEKKTDLDAGQQFARLGEAEAVRCAAFDERHAVVAQRAQVHVHRRRVRTRSSLQTIPKFSTFTKRLSKET